jgi:hypothetical protein
MKRLDLLTSNHFEFLNYLKSQYPIYHKSNIFFRDLQYGVMEFMQIDKNEKVKYSEAEKMAKAVAEFFESKEIFKKLDHQTWVLNYPKFSNQSSS